ncbi:protein BIG GRAIN 1-like B [Euphorbia lathyris]|uniref:protein BIG GRAIN 1-like B n=1 Tax=Euphorbia lathyris TaxID=212925 RepID=UPI0033142D70
MDTIWDNNKSLNQDLRRHSRHYQTERDNNPPSFSSTLLDAIYRSIDESNGQNDDELMFYRETTSKKKGMKTCMIEKWIEEKNTTSVHSVRRKSMADFDRKSSSRRDSRSQPVLLNSSSSSSDSSCGGGFSSSESESIRPKPIRTSVSVQSDRYQTGGEQFGIYRNCAPDVKAKHESKTKSTALKLYGDLKKVKQPISPGGRLATFLNSLFTAGNTKNGKNAKKAKISSSSYDERKFKSEQNSTCSSASSFSRSCLSKTPSSRGKLNNGSKRSVRFYPVSVIVGEDSRPIGHKNVYENHHHHHQETRIAAANSNSNLIHEELKFRVMNESRRVEEVARELLKNYQKKQQDDDDDDGASCASSDLFELDNLSAIGIERYREELPVYETTHLSTNRAIANGLIM